MKKTLFVSSSDEPRVRSKGGKDNNKTFSGLKQKEVHMENCDVKRGRLSINKEKRGIR